jgi:molybdopterin molybdotransferase
MLTVSQAQEIVLEHTPRQAPATVPLTPALLGLVLAEDIVSDVDMPPHDKALMDGYAIRAADLSDGRGTLTVIEEVMAGATPTRSLGPAQATRIMTGAPLPDGADAVIMVERTRILDDNRVLIEDRSPRPEQNILRRAREMKRGDKVLSSGALLRPQEIGLLAAVGRTDVLVYPAPRVAVLPTGDEVVPVSHVPRPGQIRNSNGPMLLAQVARAGGIPIPLGIAHDSLDSLRPLVTEGLAFSILVLSGGVSAGKRDLVPDTLQELGVKALFHRVEMKPGKPVFFGTWTSGEQIVNRHEGPGCLVFGLPGNPVSSLVCFELFVRPAIRRMRGHADLGPWLVQAALSEDFQYKTDRPTYHPAWLDADDRGWRVRPVPWFGSPDLRGLTKANAFVFFPPGDHRFQPGQTCTVLRVED